MIDSSQTAQTNYERATRKAFWNQIRSWLTRRSNNLLPFDEVRARLPLVAQSYRGLREVPLDLIAGSVGRYRDFDRAFLPRQRQTRNRWVSIDSAMQRDVKLPPIELYKIGEIYFVRDGNHRVSVARGRDQQFIDAFVTEIDVRVPITPDTDLDQIIRRAEQADFFNKTNLDRLRPAQAVRLSLPGQYDKLLEHINVHRWYLGVENNREMGWEEAVQSWYDHVYMPLVHYIREQNILADFPNRTETDLYLWIIEHRSVLRGNPEATPVEEAVSDFVQQRSERPTKRIVRIVKDTLNALGDFVEEIVVADLEIGGALPPEDEPEPPGDDTTPPPA
jgi:hypothetical protein